MEQYVEINTERGILRGMLHLPDLPKGEQCPGVILYHGFSGNRTEPGFMFVRFSRLLAELGIASVRFDFLGSGESDGGFTDMTFSKEADDALVILDYFRSLNMIDEDNIIILGLSMGGAIAGYIAGSRPSDLKGLILWAPAGEMRIFIEKREKEIENGKILENMMDINGLLLGDDFIEDVRSISIMGKTSEYTGKTLIVHGTDDTVVPVTVSEGYFKLFGNRAELVLIDGADHTFQGIEWIKQLFDSSITFIKGQVGTSSLLANASNGRFNDGL